MRLPGSKPEPPRRHFMVLGNAFPVSIHHPHLILGIVIPLLGAPLLIPYIVRSNFPVQGCRHFAEN